jgi:hypothetical protein
MPPGLVGPLQGMSQFVANVGAIPFMVEIQLQELLK